MSAPGTRAGSVHVSGLKPWSIEPPVLHRIFSERFGPVVMVKIHGIFAFVEFAVCVFARKQNSDSGKRKY
jgi:hypothetical protein